MLCRDVSPALGRLQQQGGAFEDSLGYAARCGSFLFLFFFIKRKSTNVENSNQVKSVVDWAFKGREGGLRPRPVKCSTWVTVTGHLCLPSIQALGDHHRPLTFALTEHRQRHFRAKTEGDIFDKFLVRLVCTTIYSYAEMKFFFLLVFKKKEVLVSRTFWGHHPWEDRCQKDSASYTVTNCGDLGTPEPLCRCFFFFFKGGVGGLSKQKTLTTDDFVAAVVILTLLGKLGYFSESHVTWAW